MGFDLASIVDAAITTIRKIQIEIQRDVLEDPSSTFEPARIGRRGKQLLAVDLVAERNAARQLRRKLGQYRPFSVGEESLSDPRLDLSDKNTLVVLMDMVDGTDLLARGLGNWCSAMVFYYPPENRIIASFVGLPDDGVYYVTEASARPVKYRFHGKPKVVPISGPSRVRNLASASIAFYGQKVPNLLSAMGHQRFLISLRRLLKAKGRHLKTRIYNLAGNPMMMRLIDGHVRIDAVFDLEGQAPHDVVPGAFIAQKANAVLSDLQGRSIDLARILRRPADPKLHIRYLVASTKKLSRELLRYLRPKSQPKSTRQSGGRTVKR